MRPSKMIQSTSEKCAIDNRETRLTRKERELNLKEKMLKTLQDILQNQRKSSTISLFPVDNKDTMPLCSYPVEIQETESFCPVDDSEIESLYPCPDDEQEIQLAKRESELILMKTELMKNLEIFQNDEPWAFLSPVVDREIQLARKECDKKLKEKELVEKQKIIKTQEESGTLCLYPVHNQETQPRCPCSVDDCETQPTREEFEFNVKENKTIHYQKCKQKQGKKKQHLCPCSANDPEKQTARRECILNLKEKELMENQCIQNQRKAATLYLHPVDNHKTQPFCPCSVGDRDTQLAEKERILNIKEKELLENLKRIQEKKEEIFCSDNRDSKSLCPCSVNDRDTLLARREYELNLKANELFENEKRSQKQETKATLCRCQVNNQKAQPIFPCSLGDQLIQPVTTEDCDLETQALCPCSINNRETQRTRRECELNFKEKEFIKMETDLQKQGNETSFCLYPKDDQKIQSLCLCSVDDQDTQLAKGVSIPNFKEKEIIESPERIQKQGKKVLYLKPEDGQETQPFCPCSINDPDTQLLLRERILNLKEKALKEKQKGIQKQGNDGILCPNPIDDRETQPFCPCTINDRETRSVRIKCELKEKELIGRQKITQKQRQEATFCPCPADNQETQSFCLCSVDDTDTQLEKKEHILKLKEKEFMEKQKRIQNQVKEGRPNPVDDQEQPFCPCAINDQGTQLIRRKCELNSKDKEFIEIQKIIQKQTKEANLCTYPVDNQKVRPLCPCYVSEQDTQLERRERVQHLEDLELMVNQKRTQEQGKEEILCQHPVGDQDTQLLCPCSVNEWETQLGRRESEFTLKAKELIEKQKVVLKQRKEASHCLYLVDNQETQSLCPCSVNDRDTQLAEKESTLNLKKNKLVETQRKLQKQGKATTFCLYTVDDQLKQPLCPCSVVNNRESPLAKNDYKLHLNENTLNEKQKIIQNLRKPESLGPYPVNNQETKPLCSCSINDRDTQLARRECELNSKEKEIIENQKIIRNLRRSTATGSIPINEQKTQPLCPCSNANRDSRLMKREHLLNLKEKELMEKWAVLRPYLSDGVPRIEEGKTATHSPVDNPETQLGKEKLKSFQKPGQSPILSVSPSDDRESQLLKRECELHLKEKELMEELITLLKDEKRAVLSPADSRETKLTRKEREQNLKEKDKKKLKPFQKQRKLLIPSPRPSADREIQYDGGEKEIPSPLDDRETQLARRECELHLKEKELMETLITSLKDGKRANVSSVNITETQPKGRELKQNLKEKDKKKRNSIQKQEKSPILSPCPSDDRESQLAKRECELHLKEQELIEKWAAVYPYLNDGEPQTEEVKKETLLPVDSPKTRLSKKTSKPIQKLGNLPILSSCPSDDRKIEYSYEKDEIPSLLDIRESQLAKRECELRLKEKDLMEKLIIALKNRKRENLSAVNIQEIQPSERKRERNLKKKDKKKWKPFQKKKTLTIQKELSRPSDDRESQLARNEYELHLKEQELLEKWAAICPYLNDGAPQTEVGKEVTPSTVDIRETQLGKQKSKHFEEQGKSPTLTLSPSDDRESLIARREFELHLKENELMEKWAAICHYLNDGERQVEEEKKATLSTIGCSETQLGKQKSKHFEKQEKSPTLSLSSSVDREIQLAKRECELHLLEKKIMEKLIILLKDGKWATFSPVDRRETQLAKRDCEQNLKKKDKKNLKHFQRQAKSPILTPSSSHNREMQSEDGENEFPSLLNNRETQLARRECELQLKEKALLEKLITLLKDGKRATFSPEDRRETQLARRECEQNLKKKDKKKLKHFQTQGKSSILTPSSSDNQKIQSADGDNEFPSLLNNRETQLARRECELQLKEKALLEKLIILLKDGTQVSLSQVNDKETQVMNQKRRKKSKKNEKKNLSLFQKLKNSLGHSLTKVDSETQYEKSTHSSLLDDRETQLARRECELHLMEKTLMEKLLNLLKDGKQENICACPDDRETQVDDRKRATLSPINHRKTQIARKKRELNLKGKKKKNNLLFKKLENLLKSLFPRLDAKRGYSDKNKIFSLKDNREKQLAIKECELILKEKELMERMKIFLLHGKRPTVCPCPNDRDSQIDDGKRTTISPVGHQEIKLTTRDRKLNLKGKENINSKLSDKQEKSPTRLSPMVDRETQTDRKKDLARRESERNVKGNEKKTSKLSQQQGKSTTKSLRVAQRCHDDIKKENVSQVDKKECGPNLKEKENNNLKLFQKQGKAAIICLCSKDGQETEPHCPCEAYFLEKELAKQRGEQTFKEDLMKCQEILQKSHMLANICLCPGDVRKSQVARSESDIKLMQKELTHLRQRLCISKQNCNSATSFPSCLDNRETQLAYIEFGPNLKGKENKKCNPFCKQSKDGRESERHCPCEAYVKSISKQNLKTEKNSHTLVDNRKTQLTKIGYGPNLKEKEKKKLKIFQKQRKHVRKTEIQRLCKAYAQKKLKSQEILLKLENLSLVDDRKTRLAKREYGSNLKVKEKTPWKIFQRQGKDCTETDIHCLCKAYVTNFFAKNQEIEQEKLFKDHMLANLPSVDDQETQLTRTEGELILIENEIRERQKILETKINEYNNKRDTQVKSDLKAAKMLFNRAQKLQLGVQLSDKKHNGLMNKVNSPSKKVQCDYRTFRCKMKCELRNMCEMCFNKIFGTTSRFRESRPSETNSRLDSGGEGRFQLAIRKAFCLRHSCTEGKSSASCKSSSHNCLDSCGADCFGLAMRRAPIPFDKCLETCGTDLFALAPIPWVHTWPLPIPRCADSKTKGRHKCFCCMYIASFLFWTTCILLCICCGASAFVFPVLKIVNII